jgi:hypothetical protein
VCFVAKKSGRAELHTTIDSGLMKGLRDLATNQGTSKYGKYVEEGLRLVLDKYGIEYQEDKGS